MKSQRIGGCPLLLLVLLLLSGCGRGDAYVIGGCYDSGHQLFEVTNNSLWYPPWIADATEVCERHSVDTNEGWLQCKLSEPYLGQLKSVFPSINPSEIKFPKDPARFWASKPATWWTFESEDKHQLKYYRQSEKQYDGYIAVNEKSGQVYYWRLSG